MDEKNGFLQVNDFSSTLQINHGLLDDFMDGLTTTKQDEQNQEILNEYVPGLDNFTEHLHVNRTASDTLPELRADQRGNRTQLHYDDSRINSVAPQNDNLRTTDSENSFTMRQRNLQQQQQRQQVRIGANRNAGTNIIQGSAASGKNPSSVSLSAAAAPKHEVKATVTPGSQFNSLSKRDEVRSISGYGHGRNKNSNLDENQSTSPARMMYEDFNASSRAVPDILQVGYNEIDEINNGGTVIIGKGGESLLRATDNSQGVSLGGGIMGLNLSPEASAAMLEERIRELDHGKADLDNSIGLADTLQDINYTDLNFEASAADRLAVNIIDFFLI